MGLNSDSERYLAPSMKRLTSPWISSVKLGLRLFLILDASIATAPSTRSCSGDVEQDTEEDSGARSVSTNEVDRPVEGGGSWLEEKRRGPRVERVEGGADGEGNEALKVSFGVFFQCWEVVETRW